MRYAELVLLEERSKARKISRRVAFVQSFSRRVCHYHTYCVFLFATRVREYREISCEGYDEI